jgi:hypothetical protein
MARHERKSFVRLVEPLESRSIRLVVGESLQILAPPDALMVLFRE